MENSLEKLLVFACLELEGSTKNVIVDAFDETMQFFLRDKQIFEKLPRIVVKTAESLKEQEDLAGSKVGLAKDLATSGGTNTNEHIEYFDNDALLIYDGIAASAFGRMSYIYRSKGIRFYLFETGEFSILTPYS